jgi:DNA sulfur modification protein DndD
MSLLFAIAKLTTVKHENDFPLIFDAPTSSFTGAKESEFFGVIGNINKQTIIVTKSFLKEEKDEDGKSILDTMRLKEIKAKKYRISKKYPFDDKNLATIETEIESLN